MQGADDLEAWQRSIDRTNAHSSEISGYILILGSTAQLEEGASELLQTTVSRIGHEHNIELARQAEEDELGVHQSEQWEVQQDKERRNSEDGAQIDNGRMEVEVEDDIHTEWPDERADYQGMLEFCIPVTRDTGITQEPSSPRIGEASKDGSIDDEDSTSSPTDVVRKRKRVSSIALPSSEVNILMSAHSFLAC